MSQLDPSQISVGPIVKAANWAAFAINFKKFRFPADILYMSICDQSGHALQAANFQTILLSRVAFVGGALTTIATLNTSVANGTALAAGVPLNVAILETGATANPANRVPAGDFLRLTFTPATGVMAALDLAMVNISFMSNRTGNKNN